MKLLIDERETALYDILLTKSLVPGFAHSLEKKVLSLGDIQFFNKDEEEPCVILERKTITDLLASIMDGRYREQSHRLFHSSGLPSHRIIYLIEGTFQGISLDNKNRVYSTMTSLTLLKACSLIRSWSIEETADILCQMATKIGNEITKGNLITKGNFTMERNSDDVISTTTTKPYCEVVKKVKKDNVTKENMGTILLCQIPGISSISAQTIMKDHTTIAQLIDTIRANPTWLQGIVLEKDGKKRKLSKTVIENIQNYLL
jgi:ERCC4-type nuclease